MWRGEFTQGVDVAALPDIIVQLAQVLDERAFARGDPAKTSFGRK